MGTVTSMCCEESDQKSKKRKQPLSIKHISDPTCQKVKENKLKLHQEQKVIEHKPITIDQKTNSIQVKQQQNQIESQQQVQPENKCKMRWEDFQIKYLIGEGGFGQVYLGELISNKAKGFIEKYAIKRIPKSKIFDKKLLASLKLQKYILAGSDCNFITKFHYSFRDQTYLYIVMELAEGGDTFSLLKTSSNRFKQYKKAGQEAVRFLLACLILGIEYLHNKNIIYRDLKPQNLLIFSNGYVKLTDFGLAKELKENIQNRTQAGTTFYYPPQMVLKQNYGKQIDLWAIGIFAYQMSNFYPPFAATQIKDRQRVKRLVQMAQKDRKWKNPNLSQQLKDFINSLLKFNPKSRLGYNSWSQIKNHKFFTCVNFDWKQLEQMKMISPLKSIIQTDKCKYKEYIPQNNKKNGASQKIKNNLDQDLDGWSGVPKNNNQL